MLKGEPLKSSPGLQCGSSGTGSFIGEEYGVPESKICHRWGMYSRGGASNLNSRLGDKAFGPNQMVIRPISREGEYIIYGPMRGDIDPVKSRRDRAGSCIRKVGMRQWVR